MIGTNIRGMRHLWRMCDYSLKKVLVIYRDHGVDICEVIKTKPDSRIGERMLLFNSCYNKCNYRLSALNDLSILDNETIGEITHNKIIEVTPNKENYDVFFSEIILLPDTFDEDYNEFLRNNSKMIKGFMTKYGIDINGAKVKRLYIYTDGSKNFFQWAIDLYFKANCSMYTITNILTWNEYYKQLTKNLSKGTITAYKTSNDINALMEELATLRGEKRINDAINSFNTTQKKLLKENELSKVDKQTLARFSKLSEAKKVNFIRKVSTIEDYDELMRQMRHATSMHFEWSKESLMDFLNNVEDIKYDVIYENDYVVLVKVENYDTIKQLAKTTNWCISKNKSYWNNYIGKNNNKSVQYMIFDFSKLEDDKLSIIGFTTTHNKGITSAHNFVNDPLIPSFENSTNEMLKSYLTRFNEYGNIYSILNKCGIDISMVVHYDKPQYKWSHDGLMSYLYECVDKNNVDVIVNENDKLVLSVRDENIRYFFGESYMDNISCDEYELQHIIFADFSKNQYDSNKLSFAIIQDSCNSCGEEDYCIGVYNEMSNRINSDFDIKLAEFGAPYDTIKRASDLYKIALQSFCNYNTKVFKTCMEKDKNCLHKLIGKNLSTDGMMSILIASVTDYLSFDYFNIIYNNNETLNNYIKEYQISEILRVLFNNIKRTSKVLYRNSVLEKPNEERIEAFYNEQLNNKEDVIYVGSYLLIKLIIEHENKKGENLKEVFLKLLHNIYNSSVSGELIKDLLYLILHKLDMGEKKDTTIYLIKCFNKFNDEEMKHTLNILCEKHHWIKEFKNELNEENKKTTVTSSSWTLEPVTIETLQDEFVDLENPF